MINNYYDLLRWISDKQIPLDRKCCDFDDEIKNYIFHQVIIKGMNAYDFEMSVIKTKQEVCENNSEIINKFRVFIAENLKELGYYREGFIKYKEEKDKKILYFSWQKFLNVSSDDGLTWFKDESKSKIIKVQSFFVKGVVEPWRFVNYHDEEAMNWMKPILKDVIENEKYLSIHDLISSFDYSMGRLLNNLSSYQDKYLIEARQIKDVKTSYLNFIIKYNDKVLVY